jgi:hypothetical protein
MYDVIGYFLMAYFLLYVWHESKKGEGLPLDYRRGNYYED